MALAKVLVAKGYDYYFVEQSLPDIADLRNILSTIWYDKTQAEHLLFVDADMAFEPQLILDMLEFDKPLVGALYPQKTLPIRFAVKLCEDKPIPASGHIRVLALGAGALLIRRDCLTRLLDSGQAKSDARLDFHSAGNDLKRLGINRMIRAFDKIDTDTGELSEDYSFCRRYINAGGEIWANINHPVMHVGQYGYTARFGDMIGA